MQAVAPVTQILHKTKRKPFMAYQHISPFCVRESNGIPVKISQGRTLIYLRFRKCVPIKSYGQGQVGIRHEYLPFKSTHSTTGSDNMKFLTQ